jgi:hypothetical protein
LLDAAASGHDILRHDEPFVRPDQETAPQDQTARFFLDEDVAFAERAPNFLADDDSAERRRDDGVEFNAAQFVGQAAANLSRDVGVLEEQRALEKLPAVEAGAKHEMAVEKRAGLAEKRQQILAH